MKPVKKALHKDFWMEIKKNKARFISIFCIVALGVAFFSGIQASSPDMRMSGDAYYTQTKLMDLKVMGTLGLTDSDVEALRNTEGVETAEGSYSTDVLCGDEESRKVLHIESVTKETNQLTVLEGKLPEKSGECFLDVNFADGQGYQLGDTLTLEEPEDQDYLKTKTYTVAGIGRCPMYISFNRGNSTLGSGEVNGFAYILPEDFDQEVYTQIYIRAHGVERTTSYTDAYDSLISRLEENVDGIQEERCRIRYDEVMAEAEQEIADAEKELEDGRKEADKELADARKELEDGEKELADGRQEYEDGKRELENAKQELKDGKAQLADARQTIADGWSQIESSRAQVNDGWAQLQAGESTLAAGWDEYYSGREQFEAGKATLEQSRKELEAGEAQIQAAKEELEAGRAQIEAGKAELDAKQQEIDAGIAQVQAGQAEIDAQVAQLQEQIPQIEAAIGQAAEAEAQLPQLEASLAAAQAAVNEKETVVAEAQTAYDAAAAQVEAGELPEEELASYEEALNAANSELAAASDALAQAQDAYDAVAATVAQKAELENSLAAAQNGIAQAEAARAELDNTLAQLNAGQAELDAGRQTLEQEEAKLVSAQEEIAAQEAKLAPAREQLEAGEQELAASEAQLNAGLAELQAVQAEIDANRQRLSAAEAEIAAGEQELISGQAEIDASEQQIADGEAEIAENEQKLADAEKELEDGEKELEDGWEEYREGEKEAREEIADGEKEIADAREDLQEIEVPEWIITDRTDLPEYSDYGDNADRIKSIGDVFPVIFFLVAALISLTTMTRMVEEQRTQIGTLKALGYGKYDIASKYLNYAFLATVSGSITGILIGQKLLPYIIIKAYGMMYHNVQDTIMIHYEWKYALIASVAAVVCTVGATVFSCYRALAEAPASLMRPPAPKEGKRVLVERITILWKHLSFTWKSSLRNLFRYKKRLFMTIFGIAGSMGLMLVGFGLRDSISGIVEKQYSQLQHYDAMIIADEDASDAEREELEEFLAADARIVRFTGVQFTKVTVASEDSNISAYVYAPENMDRFREDVTLRNRVTGEIYQMPEEGAAVSEKTADLMDLEIGDDIVLEKDNEEYSVKISVITENYMGHYIYMTPAVYEETFGEKPVYEDIVFTVKDEYKDQAEDIGGQIVEYPAALSISYTTSTADQVERMLGTLDVVIIVLIVSAGMLAFVVLYNLNNINITERQRELATLKVLGFYDLEVSEYVLRENVLLTIGGILFGCGFGVLLHRFVIVTVEVDAVMFGREIHPVSFLYCALITGAFAAVVNIFMHLKMKKIDMVESLKSVE